MNNYNPNTHIEQLESYLAKCETNSKSPYNSGWEALHWLQETKRIKKKLSKLGKQLKFNFE